MTGTSYRTRRWIGAITLVSACCAMAAEQPMSARGESSRSSPKAIEAWRNSAFPSAAVTHLLYPSPAAARVESLKRQLHQGPMLKPVQIGFARHAASEVSTPMPPLRWIQLDDGSSLARLDVHSPGAAGLRVGLQLDGIDDHVMLRIGGSSEATADVFIIDVGSAKQRLGDDGLYWTPDTDGATQAIEIHRPAQVPAQSAALAAPSLSHLVLGQRDAFANLAKIGESGSCNVDVICRVNELGPKYVNAKNAVAHMRFVVSSSTYICTGTLIADQLPGSQIPYFHTANHCFSDNTNLPPNSTQMQTVANTLNTWWNYEATSCGGFTSQPRTQLAGGAAYLHSSHVTDGMLLRLNDPAPAFAYFAGWNASSIPAGADLFGIHHPAGDAKQISLGILVGSASTAYTTAWLSGTTEGGSSGSGLFTRNVEGDYELRGGLYGGLASCANSGSVDNTQNRDYYSRLDVDIAAMGQWINVPETVFKDDFGP